MILSPGYNSRKQTYMQTTKKQLFHHGNLIHSFQTELESISDWMRVNKVSVNLDKTEFTAICKSGNES